MVELVFDLSYVHIATATPGPFEAPQFEATQFGTPSFGTPSFGTPSFDTRPFDTLPFCGLFAWLCVPDGGCRVAEHELFEAPGSLAGADPVGWLSGTPSLTERQVRECGVRPERSDLIRLPATGQRNLLPAFQFSTDGQPVPVVAMVNKLLDAASDPWGVADWWLGENAWLGGVPADLIGKVADSDLMRAAQAAISPERAVPPSAVPVMAVPDKAVPDKAVPDKAVPDKAVPDAGEQTEIPAGRHIAPGEPAECREE